MEIYPPLNLVAFSCSGFLIVVSMLAGPGAMLVHCRKPDGNCKQKPNGALLQVIAGPKAVPKTKKKLKLNC